MYDPDVPFAYNEEMVNLGPQYQIPNPELGPLERRVGKTFVEALFDDEINDDDAEYWFSEPDGGWSSDDVWAFKCTEEQPVPISCTNFAQGRTELRDLEEGAVVTGQVVEVLFYHGVKVDIGAQYDGLIPVRQEQWQREKWRAKYGVCTGVADDFEVGQEVTVRIHRVNNRPRCRWPIQLTVLVPDVQHKLTDPDEWRPPFDLRGVGSWEEACRISGRPLPPPPPPELVFRDDDVYELQHQLQSKQGTASVYGTDSSRLDDLRLSGSILEKIARRPAAGERPEASVTEDEDAYDESLSPV